MNRGDPLRIPPYQTEAGNVGVECKHTEWETFWETGKFFTKQSVRHVAVNRALLLAATCKSFKADSAP